MSDAVGQYDRAVRVSEEARAIEQGKGWQCKNELVQSPSNHSDDTDGARSRHIDPVIPFRAIHLRGSEIIHFRVS
jgi:hypothetical protein